MNQTSYLLVDNVAKLIQSLNKIKWWHLRKAQVFSGLWMLEPNKRYKKIFNTMKCSNHKHKVKVSYTITA